MISTRHGSHGARVRLWRVGVPVDQRRHHAVEPLVLVAAEGEDDFRFRVGFNQLCREDDGGVICQALFMDSTSSRQLSLTDNLPETCRTIFA